MDEDEERMVRAVIAGASEAMKFKDEHPEAFNEETMKHVTLNAEKIAKNID